MTKQERIKQEAKELFVEKNYSCSQLVEYFKGKLTYAEIKKIIRENCKQEKYVPRKVENIIGKRFDRLVVLENLGRKEHGTTVHRCLCDCGNVIEVPKGYLASRHQRSCGCLKKEITTKHNLCHTRIYQIFEDMKVRCYRPSFKYYKYYGGRGIKICEDWLNNFKNFYDWAMNNGYDETLTIERIDVNKDYCPNNCKWIPKSEQTKNTTRTKTITYNGQTKIASDWSRETGIPENTLLRRLKQFNDLDVVFYKGNLHEIMKSKEYLDAKLIL